MADQKISELTALTGANVADDDAIAIVDTSATETKKIVFSELKNALDTATGFVRITGDTMTGALDVQSTITADGLTVDGDATIQNTGNSYRTFTISANRSASVNTLGRLDYDWNGTPVARIHAISGTDATNKDNGDLVLSTSADGTLKQRIFIDQGGDISFYEDTGTTTKFFWDASAETLDIGSYVGSSVNAPLNLKSDANHHGLSIEENSGTETWQLGVDVDGDLNFHNSGNATPSVTFSDSGSVGIGTSSPSAPLTVQTSTTTSVDVKTSAVNGTAQMRFSNDARTYSLGVENSDSFFIYDATGASNRMIIDSSGNIGIGGAPASGRSVHVQGTGFMEFLAEKTGTNTSAIMLAADTNVGSIYTRLTATDNTAIPMTFHTGNTERMRLDSSGNVLIGTTANKGQLTVGNGLTGTKTIALNGSGSSTSVMNLDFLGGGSGNPSGRIGYSSSTEAMTFHTGDLASIAEAMRIDSSGNLLVSKTSSSLATDGIEAKANGSLFVTRSSATPVSFRRSTTDGDIVAFYKNGAKVGSIGVEASDLTIGLNGAGLRFVDGTTSIQPWSSTTGGRIDNSITLGDDSFRFKDLYLSGTAIAQELKSTANQTFTHQTGSVVIFRNSSNQERMRLDSSGNLLVSTTDTAPADNNVEGAAVIGGGQLQASKDGATVAKFNRKGTDGDIVQFRKNGSTVGSIGTVDGDLLVHSSATGHKGLRFGNGYLAPTNNSGTIEDNTTDLGLSSHRFDDIYATNGTIQTSDRNEKQDIAELSDAEQRVAVAAKGLLRKFRWRDAVEAKGDEARTHFGIIAQDLQAAFAAEGLDAGDYAMFTSSTWTDEETGEERTRMGVRYSELLAFIIAAI